MCKVYNSVGSLTTIKSHLHRYNIHDFNCLNEVIAFQRNYSTQRQQIISRHQQLIEQEKNSLGLQIAELGNSITEQKIYFENELRKEIDNVEELKLNEQLIKDPSNLVQRIFRYFKIRNYKRKIRNKKRNYDSLIEHSIGQLTEEHTKKNSRYQFIVSHFATAVNESCQVPLNNHQRKKGIIDEVNTFIYGALGEQKVVKELEKLSDDYFLINDFSLSFQTPIYNRQENDYIKSIQIDHILISPSGIFLIETKNWSEESLNNLSLRSPVEQIKRTNFALFKILSKELSNHSKLNIYQHHWGDRKIPLRNLIVLTHLKPKEEFQYVKILTVNEILGYLNYFKPTFSSTETQEIAHYLRNLIEATENN